MGPAKPNLPNQTYQTKPTKPNQPNQTKHTKPNLLNQIKLSQPSLLNQTKQTKPTKPKLIVKAVNAWVRNAFDIVFIGPELQKPADQSVLFILAGANFWEKPAKNCAIMAKNCAIMAKKLCYYGAFFG